jgi:bisanhydrobacterioruberin hydratase
MQLSNRIEAIANYLLIAVHVAGIVGFIFLGPWFCKLSWFSLGLSTLIVLLFSKQSIDAILLPFLLAFSIGYIVEVVGVKTGFPFGQYYYGSSFGIKLFSVPLMIGINWAILNYCSLQVLKQLKLKNFSILVIGSALLMTGMDFLIEQICMHYNFWFFSTGKAGLANYAAWFVISACISFFSLKNFTNHVNSMAVKLFLYQLLFFIFLNLYHYLK